MFKPWIRTGTFVLPNTNVFHRTADGAARSIRALENKHWRVEQEGDAIAMTPFFLVPRGNEFFYGPQRFWDVDGFRRAKVRITDVAEGIAVSNELDCGLELAFILIVLVIAAAPTQMQNGGGFFSAVLFFMSALVSAHFLRIPASFRTFIRRTIDRPAGPSDSAWDTWTR